MAAPGSALANLAAALAAHQALVRQGSGFVRGQSFPAQRQGALQQALQGIGGSGGLHFGPGGNDPGFGGLRPRPTGGAGLGPAAQPVAARPGSFGGGVPHQHPVLRGPVGVPHPVPPGLGGGIPKIQFGPGGNDPGYGYQPRPPTGGAGLGPAEQPVPVGGGGEVNPGGPMQRQPHPFPVPRPRPLPRSGTSFYPR